MKKLFTLLAFATIVAIAPVSQAEAQQKLVERETLVDTLSGTADTSILPFNATASFVKSFQWTVKKNSGTVSGKLYLEATGDGVEWFRLDSITLTDQAVNKKYVIPTATSFYSYRSWGTSAGAQNATVYFTVVRRRDERN